MGIAGGLAGIRVIQNKKEVVKCLNDYLPSYLEKVRGLEADGWRLQSKIQEHLENKGPRSETGALFQDHGGPEGSDLCIFCEQGLYLGDILDNNNSIQSIQKTITCMIVDGKMVSEVNDTNDTKGTKGSRSGVFLREGAGREG